MHSPGLPLLILTPSESWFPMLARFRSRLSLMPRLLFAGVVFSTTLIVATINPTTVRTADALVPPPVPVAVGAAMATMPAGSIALGGTLVATGGLALGAVAVGYALYATHDTWLPLVPGLGGNAHDEPPESGSPSDKFSIGGLSINGNSIRVVVSALGTVSQYSSVGLKGTLRCSDSGGYTDRTFNGWQMGLTSGSRDVYLAACSGGSPTYVKVVGPGSQVLTWGETIPDSQYTGTSTSHCRTTSGETFQVSKSFVGEPEKAHIPSCSGNGTSNGGSYPDGAWPERVTVDGGRTGVTPKRLLDIEVDPEVNEKYPDCFTAMGMTCKVRVWIQNEPCTSADARCQDWDSYRDAHPNRVDCRLGSYVIAFGNCSDLKRAYRRDVIPKPLTDPLVVPKPSPDPIAPPSPSVPPTPSVPVFPTPGPNPNPPPLDPENPPNPDSSGCLGEAWSWNPVDWVYVPIKCAFLWAFKPSIDIKGSVTGIATKVGGKFPFGIPLPTHGAIGNSCPDWSIKMPGQSKVNVVCNSSYTHAIVGARPWLTVGMLALAFWPFVRGIFYAAVPIIKPVPSGGGER